MLTGCLQTLENQRGWLFHLINIYFESVYSCMLVTVQIVPQTKPKH